MKKKVLGVILATSVVAGVYAVSGANSEAEDGIPAKIDELKVVVSDLTKQVAELLPLKDDVRNIKEEISSVKTTVSDQQTSIDSIKTEIEEMKNSQVTPPDGQQIQERLSFENSNITVVVTLSDGTRAPFAIPYRVVYLWEENNPNDKLVGITDYKGSIAFKIRSGKMCVYQFKGDDKYKPVYMTILSDNVHLKWELGTSSY